MSETVGTEFVAPQERDGRTAVEFNYRGPVMVGHAREVWHEMQSRCPVAWTEAHGGHWVFTGAHEVMDAARDDARFSSAHVLGTETGVAIPAMPNWGGIIEMDPPEFTPIRKAFVPWFTRKSAEARRPLVEMIVDYCLDAFIERGEADLAAELAAPIPALLTMQFMGFPLSEAARWAELFHLHSYAVPGTPDGDRVVEGIVELERIIRQRAAAARGNPGPDFLSFLANLRVDGELLPLEQVSGHGFLVLIGGTDTSAALLTNTLIHVSEHPEIREKLQGGPESLVTAFHEFVRFYTPVPSLARTATSECVMAGQRIRPGDRVLLSWAAANLSPELFDEPDELRTGRWPNRHIAFGIGLHRCLGANVAEVLWTSAVARILERLPDFRIDMSRAVRYPDIGVSDGWISAPATFPPGTKVGATLNEELGLDVTQLASDLADLERDAEDV
jgi:cytochrome P450